MKKLINGSLQRFLSVSLFGLAAAALCLVAAPEARADFSVVKIAGEEVDEAPYYGNDYSWIGNEMDGYTLTLNNFNRDCDALLEAHASDDIPSVTIVVNGTNVCRYTSEAAILIGGETGSVNLEITDSDPDSASKLVLIGTNSNGIYGILTSRDMTFTLDGPNLTLDLLSGHRATGFCSTEDSTFNLNRGELNIKAVSVGSRDCYALGFENGTVYAAKDLRQLNIDARSVNSGVRSDAFEDIDNQLQLDENMVAFINAQDRYPSPYREHFTMWSLDCGSPYLNTSTGGTLSSVALPDGFEWCNPNTVLMDGTHEYSYIRSADPANTLYAIVSAEEWEEEWTIDIPVTADTYGVRSHHSTLRSSSYYEDRAQANKGDIDEYMNGTGILSDYGDAELIRPPHLTLPSSFWGYGFRTAGEWPQTESLYAEFSMAMEGCYADIDGYKSVSIEDMKDLAREEGGFLTFEWKYYDWDAATNSVVAQTLEDATNENAEYIAHLQDYTTHTPDGDSVYYYECNVYFNPYDRSDPELLQSRDFYIQSDLRISAANPEIYASQIGEEIAPLSLAKNSEGSYVFHDSSYDLTDQDNYITEKEMVKFGLELRWSLMDENWTTTVIDDANGPEYALETAPFFSNFNYGPPALPMYRCSLVHKGDIDQTLASVGFVIYPYIDLDACEITLEQESYEYTGQEVCPQITSIRYPYDDNGTTKYFNLDPTLFTVSYENNVENGIGQLILTPDYEKLQDPEYLVDFQLTGSSNSAIKQFVIGDALPEGITLSDLRYHTVGEWPQSERLNQQFTMALEGYYEDENGNFISVPMETVLQLAEMENAHLNFDWKYYDWDSVTQSEKRINIRFGRGIDYASYTTVLENYTRPNPSKANGRIYYYDCTIYYVSDSDMSDPYKLQTVDFLIDSPLEIKSDNSVQYAAKLGDSIEPLQLLSQSLDTTVGVSYVFIADYQNNTRQFISPDELEKENLYLEWRYVDENLDRTVIDGEHSYTYDPGSAEFFTQNIQGIYLPAYECSLMHKAQNGGVDQALHTVMFFVFPSFDLSQCEISLSSDSLAYTGKAQKPEVTVKYHFTDKDGKDHIVYIDNEILNISYSNNVNPGTASVTVSVKDYDSAQYEYLDFKLDTNSAPVTKNFKIGKRAVKLSTASTTATVIKGKTKAFGTILLDGKKVALSDLTVTSSNKDVAYVNSSGKIVGKQIGTAKITLQAPEGALTKASNKVTVTVTVVPALLTNVTAANTSKGIQLSWKAAPKVTGATLTYTATIYDASFKNGMKQVTGISGTSYTFTGLTNGKYYLMDVKAVYKIGSKTYESDEAKNAAYYFLSAPSGVKISNVSRTAATITWKKNSKATGYVIDISATKAFKKSSTVSFTIKSYKIVQKVLSGLSRGKTYYVRMAAYKTVNKTAYKSAYTTAVIKTK